ncbi:MAG: glutaminyl-peptide cyclotransferase [Bacteroidetes bacterium]|nr:glutaminyl-peptide cyclotransferase [Bacteroidota bacterium]
MKKRLILPILALMLLGSCKNDEKILNSLSDYNMTMQSKGYHFGDKINLPKDITENAESIAISFGDKETKNLTIDPKYFTLGDNAVSFIIQLKNGESLTQDATINVYAKHPEKSIQYSIIKEYPHNPNNFVQGFQLEGNTIYESDGQHGTSQILKYNLGDTKAIASSAQSEDIFSEGATIVGDKIYQLTWQNKKGFIYNKSDLKLISEFAYPNMIGEGWGLAYDGKDLLLSDGTKNIYFINPNDPSKVVKTISVAGNNQVYDQLNELEYHKGYLYSNVWRKPIILKIDTKTGEVIGKIDLTEIAKKHQKGEDDVLNGIAFKGDNMLITGKNWPAIYEISLQ